MDFRGVHLSEGLPIFCHKQVTAVHIMNMASAVLLAPVAIVLTRLRALIRHDFGGKVVKDV